MLPKILFHLFHFKISHLIQCDTHPFIVIISEIYQQILSENTYKYKLNLYQIEIKTKI